MLQTRKDAALKRERALSYAFSHQVRPHFYSWSISWLIVSDSDSIIIHRSFLLATRKQRFGGTRRWRRRRRRRR